VEFEPKEHILCLGSCSLDIKISDTISRKTFIVVGTAFEKGEDAQSRGKVLFNRFNNNYIHFYSYIFTI
jgi:hypothetical protein